MEGPGGDVPFNPFRGEQKQYKSAAEMRQQMSLEGFGEEEEEEDWDEEEEQEEQEGNRDEGSLSDLTFLLQQNSYSGDGSSGFIVRVDEGDDESGDHSLVSPRTHPAGQDLTAKKSMEMADIHRRRSSDLNSGGTPPSSSPGVLPQSPLRHHHTRTSSPGVFSLGLAKPGSPLSSSTPLAASGAPLTGLRKEQRASAAAGSPMFFASTPSRQGRASQQTVVPPLGEEEEMNEGEQGDDEDDEAPAHRVALNPSMIDFGDCFLGHEVLLDIELASQSGLALQIKVRCPDTHIRCAGIESNLTEAQGGGGDDIPARPASHPDDRPMSVPDVDLYGPDATVIMSLRPFGRLSGSRPATGASSLSGGGSTPSSRRASLGGGSRLTPTAAASPKVGTPKVVGGGGRGRELLLLGPLLERIPSGDEELRDDDEDDRPDGEQLGPKLERVMSEHGEVGGGVDQPGGFGVERRLSGRSSPGARSGVSAVSVEEVAEGLAERSTWNEGERQEQEGQGQGQGGAVLGGASVSRDVMIEDGHDRTRAREGDDDSGRRRDSWLSNLVSPTAGCDPNLGGLVSPTANLEGLVSPTPDAGFAGGAYTFGDKFDGGGRFEIFSNPSETGPSSRGNAAGDGSDEDGDEEKPAVGYLLDPSQSELGAASSYLDELEAASHAANASKWDLKKGFLLHFKPGERRVLSVVFTPSDISPQGVEYAGLVNINVGLGDLGMEIGEGDDHMSLPWRGRCTWLAKHGDACRTIQRRARGMAARARVRRMRLDLDQEWRAKNAVHGLKRVKGGGDWLEIEWECDEYGSGEYEVSIRDLPLRVPFSGDLGVLLRIEGLDSAQPYPIDVRALARPLDPGMPAAPRGYAKGRPQSPTDMWDRRPVVVDWRRIEEEGRGKATLEVCGMCMCGPLPLYGGLQSVTAWTEGAQTSRVRMLQMLVEQEEEDRKEQEKEDIAAKEDEWYRHVGSPNRSSNNNSPLSSPGAGSIWGGGTARPFQILDWTGDHKHKRLYSRMMGKEEGKVTAKDEMDGAEADQVVAVFNDIGAPVDVDTVKQAALDMSQGHNQRVTFSCFKRLLDNMPTIIGFGGDGRENEKKGIVEKDGAEYRVTDWTAERSVHARYYFDQAVQEEGLAEPAYDPQIFEVSDEHEDEWDMEYAESLASSSEHAIQHAQSQRPDSGGSGSFRAGDSGSDAVAGHLGGHVEQPLSPGIAILRKIHSSGAIMLNDPSSSSQIRPYTSFGQQRPATAGGRQQQPGILRPPSGRSVASGSGKRLTISRAESESSHGIGPASSLSHSFDHLSTALRPQSGNMPGMGRSRSGNLLPVGRPKSGNLLPLGRPKSGNLALMGRPVSGNMDVRSKAGGSTGIKQRLVSGGARPGSGSFMSVSGRRAPSGVSEAVWEPRLSMGKTIEALERMGVTMRSDQLESMLEDWCESRAEDRTDTVAFNCFCWLMDLRPMIVTPRGDGSSRGSTRQSSRSRRSGSKASRRRAAMFARAESGETKASEQLSGGEDRRLVPQLEELLASKAKLTCLNFAGVPLGELAPANSIEKAVGLGGMTVPPSVAEPNVALLCDRIIASNVTLVKLYDTKLSDAAAIVVASMLRSALGVSELSLRCNQISDLGTTAIANAVALHDSLMSLDLSMNMVQDAGATALANALTTSTSLRSLELGYNTIGSEGGISISESLRRQSTLTRLGLGNNLLKDAGIMALTDLTKWHNTTLSSISVEHNGSHEALFTALTRTVTNNIAPPARIRFQFDPVKYQLRNRIRNNKPSLGGTAPFEWSVYPPLPRGLEFDETTGVISGVPLCYCPPRFYSVSARNSAGECTEEISIEVISGANMNLLQDMYVYSSEKDAYRTAFKFADVTGMGYLPFEKARDALTTAGIHVDASKVRALWEVMAKTPGTAPQSTIQADNFVWLAEALTSQDPDCVLRPVKLPKISRAGRFKSLAKSIAPMKNLLSKKVAKSATSTSVPDKSPAKDADGQVDHRLSMDYLRSFDSPGNQTPVVSKHVGLPPIAR